MELLYIYQVACEFCCIILCFQFTKKQLENKVKNLEKSLKQMKNQMDSLSGDNGRRLNRLASRVGQVEQTTSKLGRNVTSKNVLVRTHEYLQVSQT